MPNLEALQHNVDTAQELGFIKSCIDNGQHSDLSLLKKAEALLKKIIR
jgi:hypothetical protein